MGITLETMYDALKYFESGDTYDETFDTGVCWDLQDDYDDVDSNVCTLIQKHVPLIKMQHAFYGGVEFVADITAFVKENYDFMYQYSQDFRGPLYAKTLEEAEEEDELVSLYHGVKIIESIQTGYIPEDDYQLIYDYLKEKYKEE